MGTRLQKVLSKLGLGSDATKQDVEQAEEAKRQAKSDFTDYIDGTNLSKNDLAYIADHLPGRVPGAIIRPWTAQLNAYFNDLSYSYSDQQFPYDDTQVSQAIKDKLTAYHKVFG